MIFRFSGPSARAEARSPGALGAPAGRALWPGLAEPALERGFPPCLWSGTFLVRLLATETAPGEIPCESGVTQVGQQPGRPSLSEELGRRGTAESLSQASLCQPQSARVARPQPPRLDH